MDDLDHSMCIAEYDWTSFYEESEECVLLRPSLACPDSSNLSDSEDLGNSDPCDRQINQNGPGGRRDDLATKAEMCLDHPESTTTNPAELITEEANDKITTERQTEQLNVQSSEGELSEREIEDGNVQMQRDIREFESIQNSTDGASSEDASGVASRAEKERWFVTVNDSPARLREASVKRKRRQKKTPKDNHMCRPGQERSLENGLESAIMKDNDDAEGGRVTEYVTQANHKPGGYPSTEEDAESDQKGVISDSLQMSGEEDNLPNGDINETTIDTEFPLQEPPQLDSAESDELEDAAEFFSTHSFDSESYLSAAESVEELQHLLVEHHQLQSSLSPTENSYLLNVNTDAGNMHSWDIALSTATNSEGHECTTLTFPSAGQSFNKMPDDNSACDNDTHSMLPLDTHGFQKHEINLPASGCSSGDRLLPVPGLTVTPCSAALSPETYHEAAGYARPVYAISSFWDEMEKLTINDILQLRMGRSTPPSETKMTPHIDDHSSLECNSSDSGQMDTSDTADSSCEFSTSDFEEEHRQFFGPSPDSQSKKQSTSDSPISAHEGEESTSSEEEETPVPLVDFARKCLEDEDSHALISNKLALQKQIRKSKSVHNIQALNMEDLSLQSQLGNDENSLFLEENMVLKASLSLGALMLSPFVDEHFKISFPDEDKAKSDSWCVTVYEPEDISVVPVFDYTLCTFSEETSFSSLHDSQRGEGKPIPIFSCSHPTVRELTFPNPDYVFLSADCEEDDDISPIRVLSRSFTQGSDCGAAPLRGFQSWTSLMRKIRFPDKGSIRCRRSGAWMFPVEKITIKSVDPPIAAPTERRVSATASEFFRELAVQQRLLEKIQTTRREGIFSTLKQSDMCLVCIAFASWVLKSSDPEAADAWKAALLANVSALSAIQYLRHYVKKRNPS